MHAGHLMLYTAPIRQITFVSEIVTQLKQKIKYFHLFGGICAQFAFKSHKNQPSWPITSDSPDTISMTITIRLTAFSLT